ncbi:hypothetical protein EVAR_93662_1 [Eumeta japonica]|uniref:Uncharacterized protein n=1 Tax=Eumeta variegata TaxID=151549 RepID=A0A4C1TQV3_EUMVA|nr:hypothetical protein EVAR_93662_1 [Eumeta japonica]
MEVLEIMAYLPNPLLHNRDQKVIPTSFPASRNEVPDISAFFMRMRDTDEAGKAVAIIDCVDKSRNMTTLLMHQKQKITDCCLPHTTYKIVTNFPGKKTQLTAEHNRRAEDTKRGGSTSTH